MVSRLLSIASAAVLTTALCGCNAQKESSAAKPAGEPQRAQKPSAVSTRPIKGGYREKMERPKVYEELRQLGLFYRQYFDTFNRAPANTEEFRSYIEHDDPKLADAIKENYYAIICKIRELRSDTVVAYEREPDDQGRRHVAVGDAAVKRMDANEFEKTTDVK